VTFEWYLLVIFCFGFCVNICAMLNIEEKVPIIYQSIIVK